MSEAQKWEEDFSFIVSLWNELSEKDKDSKRQQFRRWFGKTVEKIPNQDSTILRGYWDSQQITLSNQTVIKAPTMTFHAAFVTSDVTDGMPPFACSNPEGTWFHFSEKLLFAPREVIMSVISHELAHALFRAKGLKFSKHPGQHIEQRIIEGYKEEFHAEEQAVHETMQRWGFEDDLLPLWETSISAYGPNWKAGYKNLLRLTEKGRGKLAKPA